MRLTWGVDGFGRAYLTADCRAILLCGLDGVNGYILRDYYLKNIRIKRNISSLPKEKIQL